MPAWGREAIECSLEDVAPLIHMNSDKKPHTHSHMGLFGGSETVCFVWKSQARTQYIIWVRKKWNYKTCKALYLNALPFPLTTPYGRCTALTMVHFLNSFQFQVFPISFNTSLLLHQLQTDLRLHWKCQWYMARPTEMNFWWKNKTVKGTNLLHTNLYKSHIYYEILWNEKLMKD